MAQVTDGDREWAGKVIGAVLADQVWLTNKNMAVRDHVAAALAEEREKARAPFLAVADEIHSRGTAEVAAMDDEPDEHRKNQCASRASTYARAEHLIRRAAEETE